jgi:hypothetical protein
VYRLPACRAVLSLATEGLAVAGLIVINFVTSLFLIKAIVLIFL